MSLSALQTAFGRLVSGDAEADTGLELTEAERQQFVGVAAAPGLDTVKMLYTSWRLTKLLTLAPITIDVLGDDAAEVLTAFWRQRRARGPYFIEECRAFLDFAQQRLHPGDQSRLGNVISFERARLDMRDEIARGAPRAEAEVAFDSHPALVLGTIGATVPAEPLGGSFVLHGELLPDGNERWTVEVRAPLSGGLKP